MATDSSPATVGRARDRGPGRRRRDGRARERARPKAVDDRGAGDAWRSSRARAGSPALRASAIRSTDRDGRGAGPPSPISGRPCAGSSAARRRRGAKAGSALWGALTPRRPLKNILDFSAKRAWRRASFSRRGSYTRAGRGGALVRMDAGRRQRGRGDSNVDGARIGASAGFRTARCQGAAGHGD